MAGAFILCVNAGSSTLKGSLFEASADGGVAEVKGRSVTIDRVPSAEALDEALVALGVSGPDAVCAVGHRVVHGGTEFREPVHIDDKVQAAIARLSVLAPLHNPPALAAIQAAQLRFPGVPHVAAFDTAFFADLPPERVVYPLPYEWYERWGMRRFGFHGLSHQYASGRAQAALGGGRQRVVVLHLGNGCSASAVVGEDPVATTMGFTPMEGLMMGTRSGSVDPGILLYAMREKGLTVEALDDTLNHRSGLLGVSGVSGDFRAVAAAADEGHERARLALAIYADRARAVVGSLATAMEGIDALVFTAGVGEHAVSMRADICRGLEFLGLAIDLDRNASAVPDADVSLAGAPGHVLVIQAREDVMIARAARAAIG
ncbi:MAG TPA: acetate/propionate family kinase [Candidatus Eisenbacteria bacterium]|nr:acetate/propionate family kinase [Candidatus Eisenbacteria bacterium]